MVPRAMPAAAWLMPLKNIQLKEMQCDRGRSGMETAPMRLPTGLVVTSLALAGFGAVARAQENRLPPGPGRDAVIAACSDCHGLVVLNGKHMSYGAWWGVIGDMMNNGASVPAEAREAIAGYLSENFGPQDDAGGAAPAAK